MIYGLILAWMALRGVVEGMIMIQFSDPMYVGHEDKNVEGVRCHQWFKTYHWLCIARDAVLVALVASAIFADHLCHISKMLSLTGVCIVGWELTETAYNYTRFRRFVTEHENVMGAFDLNGWPVWLLHSGRWIVGGALIVAGIFA